MHFRRGFAGSTPSWGSKCRSSVGLRSANGVEHRGAIGLLDDDRPCGATDQILGEAVSLAWGEGNFAPTNGDGEIAGNDEGTGGHSFAPNPNYPPQPRPRAGRP